MTRRYWNINLEEMMEAGVHFGHGTRKWNPRMAPYISAKRKGDLSDHERVRFKSYFTNYYPQPAPLLRG
ncbi:hypothetical protein L3X38_021397 [Prunus dulcis]|uniref:Small ribosomal subunit protein uS2c n=1 Tax=Prunus dulcis TaxID=3755 RepID=A0AAD4VUZ1_PRUDU|nr:hypothetical protein L3X38_021397 [Prunus dulcis]